MLKPDGFFMLQNPMTCRSFTAHTALARFSSERRSHARRSFGVFRAILGQS